VSDVLRSIVLASASPRRLDVLRSLGLEVEVVPSGYDEPESGLPPRQIARGHARAKLDAVRATRPEKAVVAADTVVDLEGVALGKPKDEREARAMLRQLSGRAHLVHTAYALLLPPLQRTIERLSTTSVHFYRLEDDEIEAYIASREPMDKAGAYGIQGRAAAMIESIDGDYFTVMGFPLGDFVRTLRASGFSLPALK
jgi:septum formation protein